MQHLEVFWRGNPIQFPYRIYDEISKSEVFIAKNWNLLGLYSRHHNGFIREIAILEMMRKFPEESVPFLVQLLSEYVLEIHFKIVEEISPNQKICIYDYLNENSQHALVIQSKIASYWNCYYKRNYLTLKEFPAYKLIFTK